MARKYKCFVPIILFILMHIIGGSIFGLLISSYSLSAFVLRQIWNVICFCSAIFLYKILYKRQSMKQFLVMKVKPRLIVNIACCLIIGVALHFFNQWVYFLFPNIMGAVNMDYYEKLVSYTNNLPSYLYMGILTPILEEIIIRGYFVTQCRFEFGYKNAIVLGAFAWGVMHFNLAQFLYVFVVGIILNIIFIETDSLLYTIIIHIGINVGGIIISKQGLRDQISNILSSKTGDLFIVVLAGIIALIGSVFLVRFSKVKDDR